MNYLCVCQYGHSRSVAMVRELHSRGLPAVACGWATAGTGLHWLSQWADVIFVMQAEFSQYVPEPYRHKVVAMDVGPDRWVNPYHPELAALVKRLYGEFAECLERGWYAGCGWEPQIQGGAAECSSPA